MQQMEKKTPKQSILRETHPTYMGNQSTLNATSATWSNNSKIDLNWAERQTWKSNHLMQMQRGARGFSFVAVQQGPDEIPAVSQSCGQMFTTIMKVFIKLSDDYLVTCPELLYGAHCPVYRNETGFDHVLYIYISLACTDFRRPSVYGTLTHQVCVRRLAVITR